MKNKVTIITNGYFPVPATMGGAVETLVENLVRENETGKNLDLTVFSCYDKEAEGIAQSLLETKVEFVKIPGFVKRLDQLMFGMAKKILRKDGLSFKCIFQRLYYAYKVAGAIRDNDYGKLVLENHPVLFRILKLYKNDKKYENRYYFHLHNEVTKGHGCETIMAKCSKVLGVSDYINGTFQDFLQRSGVKKEACSLQYAVLKNRVDRTRFTVQVSEEKKLQLREQYQIEKEDLVLLFTGRFSPEKGVRELLEAFRLVKNKNVKLLVVGGFFFGSGVMSPFEEEMQELAKSMKDRVRFTGYVDYAEIPCYYALSDFVVIPSVWDDPAPLTVIETLTSGHPLITTYSGGIPEYVDSGCSIVLRREEDLVQNLAEAIELLSEDPVRRIGMGVCAANKTKDWTLESYYLDFCKLLDEQ